MNTCYVSSIEWCWSRPQPLPQCIKSPSHPQASLHPRPAPSSSCPSRRWGAASLLLSLHLGKCHIWSIRSPTVTHMVPPPASLVQTTTPCQGFQLILLPTHPIQVPHASERDASKTQTTPLPCSIHIPPCLHYITAAIPTLADQDQLPLKRW